MYESHINHSPILHMIHDDEDTEKQKCMAKIAYCQYFRDPHPLPPKLFLDLL